MEAEWYARQSAVTTPGRMAEWLPAPSSDLRSLRRLVSGLVTHYRADDLETIGVPDERVAEIDSRYAESMLAKLKVLDGRDLTELRAPLDRIVGCCRDFTVLYLTFLREQGVPVRARVGFASYFAPGWLVDHEVAEVWNEAEQRWRLVDPQLGDTRVDPTDGESFDSFDVPRDRFVVAGEVWAACREGRADPDRFVVDPGLEVPETRGWLQIKHNLVQDLAALNRREMLLWDDWGLGGNTPLREEDFELLDHVADVTRAEIPDFEELRRIYERESGLRVPEVLTSINPLTGEPRTVRVSVDPAP